MADDDLPKLHNFFPTKEEEEQGSSLKPGDLPTLYSTKKTFYYNFFPTKEEEDTLKAGGHVWWRKLIEIRDIYPLPMLDPANPWAINKTLTSDEVASSTLVLSFHDVFEHVIRYWDFDMANCLVGGRRMTLPLCDLTYTNPNPNPKIYWVYFQMMADDNFVISFMEGIYTTRKLKFDDQIQMFWDISAACFKFRLVL